MKIFDWKRRESQDGLGETHTREACFFLIERAPESIIDVSLMYLRGGATPLTRTHAKIPLATAGVPFPCNGLL